MEKRDKMAQEQEKNSPNQGQINIKLPEKGLFFLNQKARYKVAVGERGSAKSVTMGICSLIKAIESKKRLLCTRQYTTNIKDSIHKLLSDYIYSLGFAPFFEITKDSIRCYNGSEYIFSGVQNNIAGIKSMEGIDICICEEAQTMSNESWEILIPTIRKEGSEFWIAFNPESEDDPTYQRFVKNPPDNCLTVQMNYTDNPFFPEVLRQEMEYCKRVDYFKYQHIWEGQPTTQTEALVFKGKFVVQDFEIPSRYDIDRFFIGVDWGFSKDPTTMVLSFIKDNCLYICREGYGIGVDLAQIPQKIFSCVPEAAQGWPIYCDNARPETISFLKARRWRVMVDGKPTEVSYNLKPADKWKGSVEDGVDRLKSVEKIIIHPSCKHTLEEFSHYCYETDKRTGEILPKLVDTYNHCIDGIRYSLNGYITRKGADWLRAYMRDVY